MSVLGRWNGVIRGIGESRGEGEGALELTSADRCREWARREERREEEVRSEVDSGLGSNLGPSTKAVDITAGATGTGGI